MTRGGVREVFPPHYDIVSRKAINELFSEDGSFKLHQNVPFSHWLLHYSFFRWLTTFQQSLPAEWLWFRHYNWFNSVASRSFLFKHWPKCRMNVFLILCRFCYLTQSVLNIVQLLQVPNTLRVIQLGNPSSLHIISSVTWSDYNSIVLLWVTT